VIDSSGAVVGPAAATGNPGGPVLRIPGMAFCMEDYARSALAASGRARRLTRFALRRFWQPVGSGVMPPDETRHLLAYLLAGQGGERTAASIDARVDRLPGLKGLGLIRRATAGLTDAAGSPTRLAVDADAA
jgi:hypothetical protein